MNSIKVEKSFKNVMGLGDIDYEFNLDLTEKEALLFKYDPNKLNSLKDCKSLLQNKIIKDKITISSRNNLINLLLFINKTNVSKSFTEFISINCLFLNQDLAFIKEKIKNEFDDNFLYLIESNIISPCKFKLNINVENKESKSFESELTETSTLLDDSNTDNKATEEKKIDLSKNNITKKSEDGNKASDSSIEKAEVTKNSDNNKKVEDTKKNDPITKKPENNNKAEDPKTNNSKDTKKSEKPKLGRLEKNINKILLPNVSKPKIIDKEEINGVEANDDLYLPNHLNKIVYDFSNCDYFFIDLNRFLKFSEINLLNLLDFIKKKIINEKYITNIIMIFPGIYNEFNKDHLFYLIDLISVADIAIYDKRDAMRLTKMLGYNPEEDNFEIRFMYLKEFKKRTYKTTRRVIFFDDFYKLTIIAQDKETNLITSVNEFNFDIGFKVDYYNAIIKNYEFLKHIFLGGFFSRIIEGLSAEDAFYSGKDSFLKVLKILQNNLPLPDDPDYFIVNNIEKPKKEIYKSPQRLEKSTRKKSPKNIEDYTKNSTSPSRLNSSRINNHMTNSIRENTNTIIDMEQKKLMNIVKANEKIQERLNKLLSLNGIKETNVFNPSKSMVLNRKIPILNSNETKNYTKIFEKRKFGSKSGRPLKLLKPISREAHGRLIGNEIKPFESFNDNSLSNNQSDEELRNEMKLINNYHQKQMPYENKKENILTKKEVKLENNKTVKKEDQNNPNLELFMKQLEINYNMLIKQSLPDELKNSSLLPKKQIFSGHLKNLERIKREMYPVCNLGYIPIVDPEQEIHYKLINKPKFKDPHYWDSKHNNNKFKYLERQRFEKDEHSFEIKGNKPDYDDLNRSHEKQKRREEEELEIKQKFKNEELEKEEIERKEREMKNEMILKKKDKKNEEKNKLLENKKSEEKKPEEKKLEEINKGEKKEEIKKG